MKAYCDDIMGGGKMGLKAVHNVLSIFICIVRC